ncbi:MAG TPA: hypothetical protein VIW80_07790 [Pyrinomonadaceae bacterium]
MGGSEEANTAPPSDTPESLLSLKDDVPPALAPEPSSSSPEMAVTAAPIADAPVSAREEVAAPTVLTDETDARAEAVASAATPPAALEADAEMTRRHRVKVAARDAMEGKIAPRVEKMRRASTVMLDEAADDPGLRFVLIAALLILLSLGLVLLSQILK